MWPRYVETSVIAWLAKTVVRRRWLVLVAWAGLAVLFLPQALGVQQVLAVRGGSDEETESFRAAQLLKQAFPGPFAEYVAVVVHGPISRANRCSAAMRFSVEGWVENRLSMP